MTSGDAIAIYTRHAARLRKAWAMVSAEGQLAAVAGHLPAAPARVVDVGAGIGTLTAWLSDRGHERAAQPPGNRAAGVRFTWLVLHESG